MQLNTCARFSTSVLKLSGTVIQTPTERIFYGQMVFVSSVQALRLIEAMLEEKKTFWQFVVAKRLSNTWWKLQAKLNEFI